jgi:hypothetical protein
MNIATAVDRRQLTQPEEPPVVTKPLVAKDTVRIGPPDGTYLFENPETKLGESVEIEWGRRLGNSSQKDVIPFVVFRGGKGVSTTMTPYSETKYFNWKILVKTGGLSSTHFEALG